MANLVNIKIPVKLFCSQSFQFTYRALPSSVSSHNIKLSPPPLMVLPPTFLFIFNTSEFHPQSFLSALQFKSWNIPLLLEALGFSSSSSLPMIFSTFHWQFCLSQNNLTSCLLSSKSNSDLTSASLIYSLQKHYVGWVLEKFWEMVQRAWCLGP